MKAEEELALLAYLTSARQGRSTILQVRRTPSSHQPHQPPAKASRHDHEPSIREMLHTATKKPQAILKISSYGKGRKKIAAHLRYISRRGDLALENERGHLVKGIEEQDPVLNGWEAHFGGHCRSRDTVHLVLSSPPGADRRAHRAAAQTFLKEVFAKKGYEYLFVAHEDTAHPHVHAVIKMVSHQSKKLNPRKADLSCWRKEFARICRHHRIDVEASRRCERGLSGYSQRSGKWRHMKKSQKRFQKDNMQQQQGKGMQPAKANASGALKVLKRNQLIRKRYADQAKKLAVKAYALADPQQKKQYYHAAQLLKHQAKILSVEKITSSLDSSSQSIFTKQMQDPLYHYYAVTQGKPDVQGVYTLSSRQEEKFLERGEEIDI